MNELKLNDSEMKDVSGGTYTPGKYYIDRERCIWCGTCECECPYAAIEEDHQAYAINQELCVACGKCVDSCPTEAIFRA